MSSIYSSNPSNATRTARYASTIILDTSWLITYYARVLRHPTGSVRASTSRRTRVPFKRITPSYILGAPSAHTQCDVDHCKGTTQIARLHIGRVPLGSRLSIESCP